MLIFFQWGGCSSINSMAYARSAIGAYQLWADLVDDQTFTYDNLVQYYKKSMDFTPPDAETRFANTTPSYNESSIAEGGPLAVSYPAYGTAWSTWVAKGMAALGIPQTDSAIDGTLSGSAYLMLTINHPNGHRASAATQYLRPYLGRKNLYTFPWTLAERVIFDSDKVAKGVEVTNTTSNTTYTISASKEVILSAGVFQSPQLLMVSGVGPKALLEEFDIDVVADLPGVGQGMDDHLYVPVVYPVNLEDISTVTEEEIEEFNNEAIGRLTTTGSDYVAFETIPEALQANWSAETTECK
jgi:choline dehydrogenase